jgi:hypothetical protein
MVAAETGTWIAKHIGWQWTKDVALPWIGRGLMTRLSGIEFYPNRHDMQRLDKLLVTAKSVDAIVVIGRTLLEHELDSISKFKRVIFPNPECPSIQHYAKTVNELDILQITAAKATKKLVDQGIKVKWYPHAIHHTVLLVDAELNTGWVQVECVLPYSAPNLRPRWVVHRSREQQLVMSMKDIFSKMWTDSVEPKAKDITRLIKGGLTLVTILFQVIAMSLPLAG